MEMKPVKSSNIEAIGYDPETEKLRVAFKGGALYEYDQVPAVRAEDFLTVESSGGFFAEHIKGKYKFKKLPS